MKKKPKRDHRFFERWARGQGMKPVCRVSEPDGDVLIADSGKKLSEPAPGGYVRFFYRTAYAIERPSSPGKSDAWIAASQETDVFDPQMLSRTDRGAQEFRVNEALAYARNHLRKLAATGIFNETDPSIDKAARKVANDG